MIVEFSWCTRENLSKWCRRKKREGTGFGGAYVGFPGCYRPEDDAICLGLDYFLNLWLRYDDDELLVKEVAKVICHEEDHRAIYYATNSVRTTLRFDLLFTALYNYKKNREWFILGGEMDPWKPMKWESLKERRQCIWKNKSRGCTTAQNVDS